MLEPRLGFRRLVVTHRVAITGLAQARMGRDELMAVKHLHDRVGRLQPQLLADERERH